MTQLILVILGDDLNNLLLEFFTDYIYILYT